jgi:hypothetical protein
MALAVTVLQAAAMLMPVLLLVDYAGLAAFRKYSDRRLVLFLDSFGLVGNLDRDLQTAGREAGRRPGRSVHAAVPGAAAAVSPKPDSPPPPRWLGAILTTMLVHQFHRARGRSADQRLRHSDAGWR